MSNRPGPRTPTSIALNKRERLLAEAIGRMQGEVSAGHGVRAALRFMEDHFKVNGLGDELRETMAQIERERAERDA